MVLFLILLLFACFLKNELVVWIMGLYCVFFFENKYYNFFLFNSDIMSYFIIIKFGCCFCYSYLEIWEE